MDNKAHAVRFNACSVKITPPTGTSLAGYFTDRKADRVHDDLYARLLLLEKNGTRLLLVACDLIGVPREFALPVREAIAGRTGIPVDSIMLAATHTHTGPVMSGPLADQGYLETTGNLIVSEAVKLASQTREGFVTFASERLPGYAFNRRYLMKNGGVLTNPGPRNPDAVEPAGPVDDSVNVLSVSGPGGTPETLVVNTALHPDTISGCGISADWPGYLSRRLKEKFGESVTVLVLNGAQGDINHFDVFGGRVVQNLEEARRLGLAYGDRAAEIVGRARPVKIDRLGGAAVTASVPCRRVKPEDYAQAKKIVELYGETHDIEKSGRALESQDIARGDLTVQVFFAKKLIALHENSAGKSVEVEVSALRLGEIALVGLGGEPFTEIGLEIKNSKLFRHTLVVALANGSSGYLPTASAFRQGGYETMTTRLSEKTDEIIREAALGLLEKLA